MYSKTLSEILRQPWFIEHQTAMSWLPQVAQMIKGDSMPSFEKMNKEHQIEAKRFVVNEDGQQINTREIGMTPEGSIGVVMITGPMIKYGNWYCWGSDELVSFARAFDNDPNIIGQIWLLDTGGGSVNAIAPYLDFLKTKKKPVVGLADTCASAGYYIGCATDALYADNEVSAMFGSIGVMTTMYNYKKMMEELGVQEINIYADQSSYKHKTYLEAMEDKPEGFKQEFLNPLAITFQDRVKLERPNINLDIEGIIEGKMFYAQQALEYNMIDGITNMAGAIAKVKLLASVGQFMNS